MIPMADTKKSYITPEERRQFRAAMKNIALPTSSEGPTPVLPRAVRIAGNGATDHFAGADPVFYKAPGLQSNKANRLRQGKIGWRDMLDLHGDDRLQARRRLENFLSKACAENIECVLLIHGKGKHSAESPSLKNRVTVWLRSTEQVLAYCSAQPRDGGTGALYALLKRR